MKEMELFVTLIDEKEADKILNYFKESPLGSRKNTATLKQKKLHINKIFKSKTPNVIKNRKKGGADPFYNYINNYKSMENTIKDFREMTILLNEVKGDKFPDFVRYALLLINFPVETREKISDIERNIDQGLDPLSNLEQFNSNDDIKSFLRNARNFIGDNIHSNLVSVLEPYQGENYNLILSECKKEISEYDLLKYYNEKEILHSKYSIPIVNSAYIETHSEEDKDILLLLAIESMYIILNEIKDNGKGLYLEEIRILTDKLKNKNKDLIKKENDYARELSEKNLLEIKYKNGVSNEIILEEKLIELELKFQKELERHDEKIKEYVNNLKGYEKEREIFILEQKEEINKKNKEIDILKLKNQDRKEIFKIPKTFNVEWGIICISHYDLVKEMFPEIQIANAENKNEYEELIKNPQIKEIYLIMRGLSTKKYQTLSYTIKLNEKKLKFLEFENYKDFMEWIGYKKIVDKGVHL